MSAILDKFLEMAVIDCNKCCTEPKELTILMMIGGQSLGRLAKTCKAYQSLSQARCINTNCMRQFNLTTVKALKVSWRVLRAEDDYWWDSDSTDDITRDATTSCRGCRFRRNNGQCPLCFAPHRERANRLTGEWYGDLVKASMHYGHCRCSCCDTLVRKGFVYPFK